MNMIASQIYSRGFDRKAITDEEARVLLNTAAKELNRLHDLLWDPFIRGYLERFGERFPANGREKA